MSVGHDFEEENISALEENFSWQERRYAHSIYNTEYKLYILKFGLE